MPISATQRCWGPTATARPASKAEIDSSVAPVLRKASPRRHGKGILNAGIVDQLKTSVGKLQRRVETKCRSLDRTSFQIGGGGGNVAGTIEVLSTQDRIAAGEKRRRLAMQFDTTVLE